MHHSSDCFCRLDGARGKGSPRCRGRQRRRGSGGLPCSARSGLCPEGAWVPVGLLKWGSRPALPLALVCQPALHVVGPERSPLPAELTFYFPANDIRCPSAQSSPCGTCGVRGPALSPWPCPLWASPPGSGLEALVLPWCGPRSSPRLQPCPACCSGGLILWPAAAACSPRSCLPGTQLQGGSVTQRRILRREREDVPPS